MLVLVTLIVAVGVSLPMTTEGGRQAALDSNVQQMEGFGMQVGDEMYAAMEQGMRFAADQHSSASSSSADHRPSVRGILFGVFAV